MSQDPKVSICIASYNHARFLPAAIESALAQTFRDFEIVIVDDASTDDSFEIAKSYAAEYPALIRLFTHPGHRNRGISATVNLACEMSRGEYWMGLPSDDLLYPEKLERQVEFLDKHRDIGWVYSYADYIDGEGERLPQRGPFGKDITRSRDALETLIQDNYISGMTVLMRREASEKAGPFDESLVYSDWDFWVRMLVHSKVAFMDSSLVMYRVHTYNTSVGIDEHRNIRHGLDVMQSLKRKSASIGGALVRPRTQALLDLQIAYHLFVLGNEEEASGHLTSAFETEPTLKQDSEYFTQWLKERTYYLINTFPAGSEECSFSSWVLHHLPGGLSDSFIKRVAAVDFARAAFGSYQTDLRAARRLALKCFARDSSWLREKNLLSIFLESLIGAGVTDRLRKLKRRAFNNDSPKRSAESDDLL